MIFQKPKIFKIFLVSRPTLRVVCVAYLAGYGRLYHYNILLATALHARSGVNSSSLLPVRHTVKDPWF